MALLVLCIGQTHGHDDPSQHDFFLEFLGGTYVLIGKHLDSDDTFLGEMVLTPTPSGQTGYREVSGVRTEITGTIEHPECCESTHVLRIRFKAGNRELEATYQWGSDLDNYGRLSGYVYDPDRPSDWPGMESLFIDRRSEDIR